MEFKSIVSIPKDEQARDHQNYFILDGRTVHPDEIPENIREFVCGMCHQRNIVESYPLDAVRNDFCQIISSTPAINPINGSVAMPQYAFLPNDQAVNPECQFFGNDDPKYPLYLGIVLNADVPPLTLKSIDITVRAPTDAASMLPNEDMLNRVPVPVVYQLFGTSDVLSKGNKANDLNWEPIGSATRIAPNKWSFITPTEFHFPNVTEEHREALRWRGFKFVVFEWDYDNASDDDRLPGIGRIKFQFDPKELAALGSGLVHLPNVTSEIDHVGAIDFSVESCELNQATEIELDSSLMESHIQEINQTGQNQIDLLKSEMDDKKQILVHELESYAAELKTGLLSVSEIEALHSENLTQVIDIHSKVIDKLASIVKMFEAMNTTKSYLDDLAVTMQNTIDEFNQAAVELNRSTESDTVTIERISISVANLLETIESMDKAAEEFKHAKNIETVELSGELRSTAERLDELHNQLMSVTEIVTNKTNVTEIPEFVEMTGKLSVLDTQLDELDEKVADMAETTHLAVASKEVTGYDVSENMQLHNYTVVSKGNVKDYPFKINLFKSPTDGDNFTIENQRIDGGKVIIDSCGKILDIILDGKAYQIIQLGLEKRGERITVVYYDGRWLGRVETGLK